MGGTPLLVFDLFQQFLPSAAPYAGSRHRIHAMADAIGKATTDFWGSLQPNTEDYDDLFLFLAGDEWVVTPRRLMQSFSLAN